MATKKQALRIVSVEPSKLPVWAADLSRTWSKLETLRIEVYRRVMPNLPAEIVEAMRASDQKKLNAILMRADRQWVEAMGVPALTPDKFGIVMATVEAAGYPATDAGLHAWTIENLKQPPAADNGDGTDVDGDGRTSRSKSNQQNADDNPTGLVARAVAALYANPGWTNKQIAENIGCHPKTLNKSYMEKFKDAKKALKHGRERYYDDARHDRRIVTGPDRRRRPSNIDSYEREDE